MKTETVVKTLFKTVDKLIGGIGLMILVFIWVLADINFFFNKNKTNGIRNQKQRGKA